MQRLRQLRKISTQLEGKAHRDKWRTRQPVLFVVQCKWVTALPQIMEAVKRQKKKLCELRDGGN